jgi:hypothetical protein
MIHDQDLSGHKTWRMIYGALFVVNIILSPSAFGAILTGVFAFVIAFLLWGQQKAIDDIKNRNR